MSDDIGELARLRKALSEQADELRDFQAGYNRLREQIPQFARLPSFAAWLVEHASAKAEVMRYREREPLVQALLAALDAFEVFGKSSTYTVKGLIALRVADKTVRDFKVTP